MCCDTLDFRNVNDVIDNIIREAVDEESSEIFAGYPLAECVDLVSQYQRWIAETLSSRGYVSLSEVQQALVAIGFFDINGR